MSDIATVTSSRPARSLRVRAGRLSSIQRRDVVIHAATFAILMILLQLGSQRFGRIIMPAPLEVVGAFVKGMTSGALLEAWGESAVQLLTAMVIVVLLGVPLGILLGRYHLLGDLTAPLVYVLYVIPRVAVLPVVTLWFGYQDTAKIIFILAFSFFEVVITVREGVHVVDRDYIEVSRSYGVSESRILRQVILPAIVPYIITGLRLGLLYGLVGVVLAGFFLEANGIGGYVYDKVHDFRSAELWSAIITISLVGLLISSGLRWLEMRVAPWRASSVG